MSNYPDFFHIGLMKTGTTSIQEMLQNDSRINLILKKKFFNSNLYYNDEYKYCIQNKINIESDEQLLTIDNFYSGATVTLSRIKAKAPTAKIILTIREQRSLLESAFKHVIRFTTNYYKDIEEFLNSREGNVFLYMTDLENIYKELLNFFPKENIFILLYEDLRKDYLSFYKQLYDILGISLPDNFKNIKSNLGWSNRLINLKLKLNKIKIFNSGQRIISIKTGEYKVKDRFNFLSLSEEFITRVILFLFKRSKNKKIERLEWNKSDLCLKLEDHFKQSNNNFYKISGVDISKYNYLM